MSVCCTSADEPSGRTTVQEKSNASSGMGSIVARRRTDLRLRHASVTSVSIGAAMASSSRLASLKYESRAADWARADHLAPDNVGDVGRHQNLVTEIPVM